MESADYFGFCRLFPKSLIASAWYRGGGFKGCECLVPGWWVQGVRVPGTGVVGGCCWCQKETLRDLWSQTDAPTAIKFFKEWCRSLIHTKLEAMKAVAWTIKKRLDNVVSYCTHRITNSVAERMNGKIMSMKRPSGRLPKC